MLIPNPKTKLPYIMGLLKLHYIFLYKRNVLENSKAFLATCFSNTTFMFLQIVQCEQNHRAVVTFINDLFYIKILIYKITQQIKRSQSPGTENSRCLGIQKKKKSDLNGLNKLHMKKQGFFKKEVVRIFQWIKYSQWLR